MRPTLPRALASLALCAVALAACGDDGGGSSADDEKAIRDVLVKAITTDDPEVECAATVTPEFVRTVYGSEAQCRKAEQSPEDGKATGADVRDIEIDGDKAMGVVTVRGGDTAGASGEISFAKDGDAWKVDGLSIGFLRSQVDKGIANSDEEPFDDRAFGACFRDKVLALPEDRFRRFAYDSISDRSGAGEIITPLLTECQKAAGTAGGGGSDVSFIRRKFEEGIEKEAREDGVPAARIECIKRELRDRISDDEILEQATGGGGKATPQLRKATVEAVGACQ